MPIKIQSDLPAKHILEEENIFVMDETRATHQDIRPLEIAILNLMPLKEDTELHLLRSLSNTPLQVNVTFLHTGTHESKNVSARHLNQFYKTYDDIRGQKLDGLIITGAPVENMAFEEINYWEELTQLMDWSARHVTSTLHICWGAQAGLYHHYGIDKYPLEKKLSGVYRHTVMNRKTELLRGFDDVFYAPHSRYTGVDEAKIAADPRLTVLAKSEKAGVYLVIAENGKQIFVLGHPEYDRMTLDAEYRRDLSRGLNPEIPEHYYPEDDPNQKPLLTWRANANNLYTNWLNYYVYQVTPYNLEEMG